MIGNSFIFFRYKLLTRNLKHYRKHLRYSQTILLFYNTHHLLPLVFHVFSLRLRESLARRGADSILILEPANISLLAAQDEADSRRHTYRKIPSQLVARST